MWFSKETHAYTKKKHLYTCHGNGHHVSKDNRLMFQNYTFTMLSFIWFTNVCKKQAAFCIYKLCLSSYTVFPYTCLEVPRGSLDGTTEQKALTYQQIKWRLLWQTPSFQYRMPQSRTQVYVSGISAGQVLIWNNIREMAKSGRPYL